MRVLALAALCLPYVHAQDQRRVLSPDGQVELRLFIGLPDGAVLNCLAYHLWWHGKPVLDTSYLGLHIHFQEPLLGENVGLSNDRALHGSGYNGIFADYLQTSTTGRRIQLEARVYNDGVAFRYTVPQSPLLVNLLLEDDVSQFYFAHESAARPEHTALPYIEQEPGPVWVGIYAEDVPGFPRMQLARWDAHLMSAHLPDKPHDPGVAYEVRTPWTSPWHIIALGGSREAVAQSAVVHDLASAKDR